jgi:hypothetical protein
MYLQKVISRKNCVKKLVFAGCLKVNDENSRIRIQDPDPDSLVRGMDPRIRIRIHPKMSWIRNTDMSILYGNLKSEISQDYAQETSTKIVHSRIRLQAKQS